MELIQLEFNLENTTNQEIFVLQKQIDQICESMGKVRKKLFSEMGELKDLYHQVLEENQNLKNLIKELKEEKVEWSYDKNDDLFHSKS